MHLERVRVRVRRPLSELRAVLLPERTGGGRSARRRPNLSALEARRELPVHRRRPSRSPTRSSSRSAVRDARLVRGHTLAYAHPEAHPGTAPKTAADAGVARERHRVVAAQWVLLEGSWLVACSLSFASETSRNRG